MSFRARNYVKIDSQAMVNYMPLITTITHNSETGYLFSVDVALDESLHSPSYVILLPSGHMVIEYEDVLFEKNKDVLKRIIK